MIRIVLLVMVLAACGTRAPQQLDRVFESARLQLRQGRLREALEKIDHALQTIGSRAKPVWQPQLLLLKAEILITLGKSGEALKILDREIQPDVDSAVIKVRSLVLRARAKTAMRDYAGARTLLEEALQLAAQTDLPALQAEAQIARTSLLITGRDWVLAEKSARDAVELANRSGDAYLETAALGNLGSWRLFNSRYDEAIPWYEQSLATSEKNDFRRFTAMIQHNLGICYRRLGDYDKALQLLTRAENVQAQIGSIVSQEKCLGDMGAVHRLRGDLGAAISCYRKALALARQIQASDDIALWQNNLAGALIEVGELDSAEASIREALTLRQKMPDDSAAVWAQLNLAHIAAARHRLEEAEKSYTQTIESAKKLGMTDDLLQARSQLGSLYLHSGDARKAEAQFQALVWESESSRSKLRRDEWKLTFQSSVIPFYDDYVDFLMEHGRVERALEVAESCRARLLAEKLGLDPKRIRRATAADFRAKARAGNAALLSYWLAPRRSFVWVVTPDKVQSFILPPEKEISRLVESYTNLILQSRNPLETANAAGLQLFDALVAPARKLIRPGANIIVVPDGALHELNFETLLVSPGQPHYWIEDATVAVAPSLAVLQPDGLLKHVSGRLLLLGNPIASRPEYPALPGSKAEIDGIQNLYQAQMRTVLTGPEAHPDAYKDAAPGRFSVIHFSAHAIANRESPLDSAVILSPRGGSYKLYARDVATMPLHADLVTISACRSAGARAYSGEGLVGFTWAFLQAGARNVIAGLWDVSDRSTSELMTKLYSETAKGTGPAAALRTAKLALLRSAGPYQKPYYWAPFQVFTCSMPFQNRSPYVAQRHE